MIVIKIKNRLARLQYACTLEKTVYPLVFGRTVKNLIQKDCLQLQCIFPIGFCNEFLLGGNYALGQEILTNAQAALVKKC